MRTWLLLAVALGAFGAEPGFSHKRHAEVQLACTFCHKGAATGDRAGFPGWKTCATCHVELAERVIPSGRVYRLPDFVFFSHGKHAAGKVACAACHGEMKTQATVGLFRSTKMAACVECHKENRATVACNACHELGQ